MGFSARGAAAWLLVATAAACGPAAPRFVALVYEGQPSINDRCPVRERPLSADIAPVWVNGRPVGFC